MSLNIKTAVTPENPTGYIRVAGNASNVTTASNVIYTNTTSELSAGTVQAAIDEIATNTVNGHKLHSTVVLGGNDITVTTEDTYQKDTTNKDITTLTTLEGAVAQLDYRTSNVESTTLDKTGSKLPTEKVVADYVDGEITVKTIKVNDTALTPGTDKDVDITITTSSEKNGVVIVNGVDKTVYTHPSVNHIPADGAAGNTLRWDSAGKAKWEAVDTTPTDNSTGLVTSGGVKTALDNKANKTTISSVDSTVSVNTVPECLGYAGVKMIGGKTEKVTPESGDPYLINGAVERIVSKSVNIWNGNYTTGGGVRKSDGEINPTPSWAYSDYIEILPNKKMYIGNWSVSGTSSMGLVFYDSSKNYISGINYTSQFDETGKMNFVTPTNAKYIRLSLYVSNLPMTNPYVSYVDAYSPYFETELSIPDAIKNLPDYGCSAGDVYNYVDFNEMKYYRKVANIRVGDLSWGFLGSSYPGVFYANISQNLPLDDAKNICAKYDSVDYNQMLSTDKSCYVGGNSAKRVLIHNSEYSTVSAFKQDNEDLIIYYELATPEVYDISSILAPIPCETGGTITLVNEHSLDVPNTIVYKKEV